MTTQPTPDIDPWLEGLRGQNQSPETNLLRQLIHDTATPVPPVDPQRREAFIAGLRRRGAFRVQPEATQALARLKAFFAPFQGHGFALAASVAVLGIGLSLTWRLGVEHGAHTPANEAEPDIVMRGDEQAQRLVTANPRELANQIGEVLAKYQLPLRRVENGPLVQIQAKVPPGHPVRQELMRLGVPTPAHGRLNILLVQG